MNDTLNIRFNEGWAMLRRSFNFAELDYEIPKLSLVYVYSERPIFKKHVKEEYYEELERQERMYRNVPDWMQVATEIGDEVIPDDQKYETYEGEMVQTLFSGHLTKFYPEEYQPTDIKKFQKQPDFHHCYKLRKNDDMYLKQSAMMNKVHYLMSRGINRKLAELLTASTAKHSVWYEPTEELQSIFVGLEPLRKIV